MSTSTTPAMALTAAPSAITDASLPNDKTLKHAARMAMEQDKPIMLDYYADTRDGKAFLGEDATTKEQMLVRSESEYTSGIEKKFKICGHCPSAPELLNDFNVWTNGQSFLDNGQMSEAFCPRGAAI